MASSTTVKSTNANLPALALVGVVGGSAIVFSVLSAPFLVIPAFRRLGAIPWMTTPMHITKQAISQLVLRQSHINNKKSTSKQLKKFIDLGSGDGRVVIAAAQAGYQATGIELNPVLVSLSYIAAYRAGVLSKVSFRMKDFWSINLREYDAISIFGVNPVMEKLHEKLDQEAKPHTLVLCFRFPMKRKTPVWRDKELYLYEVD